MPDRPVTQDASPEIQELFAQARALHRAGLFGEAERLYRSILTVVPRHADSIHLMGVLAAQMGQFDRAATLINDAIALNGNIDSYHSNLGLVFQNTGQIKDAEAQYRKAITLKADSPEAHNNLGNVLKDQGRLNEAIASYRQALDLAPDIPEPHNNLGLAFQKQGRWDEASGCHRKAIALKWHFPEAHYNLGLAQQEQGLFDAAIASYRQALILEQDDPKSLNNLGLALQKQGRVTEAVICFRRSLALRPNSADIYNNLGLAFHEQGKYDETIPCYRRAALLNPDDPDPRNNLGTALQELGRWDEALRQYRDATRIRPEDPRAHYNMGLARQEQGLLEEACHHYRRAIGLKADHPGAHNNLAMALLAQGEMERGWSEYEWRWETPEGRRTHRNFAQPQWRGEAAAGQRLLIHAEQGFGDTLQFCRYAALATAQGLEVILEVQKPLLRLLRKLPKVHQVVALDDEKPPFDLHCPMLSMPLALGTTLATIPSARSYLHADEILADAWRERLTKLPEANLQVGLVWAGGNRIHSPLAMAVDRRRSIAPNLLSPLFTLPGVRFFSLQKGGPPAPADFPMIDVMDEMADFADTAALIVNLDLVISVDTAVAHLAAALGKPVWLLDRFDPCWRWLRHREDSPWYPSLRLFRQSSPGDWSDVVENARMTLHRILEDKKVNIALSSPITHNN